MSADEIETIAADWLAREDRGLTAEERDMMELWLDQSSRHKVAYLRLKESWRRAGRPTTDQQQRASPALKPSRARTSPPARSGRGP